MPDITDSASLVAALEKDFKEIIDAVVSDIFDNLQESMDAIVYAAGKPAMYERQGERGGLFSSFQKEVAKVVGDMVMGSVEQHPETMKHNPRKYIHGDKFLGSDNRFSLSDMIIEGRGYSFGGYSIDSDIPGEISDYIPGWWEEPRDFWTPIVSLIEKGTVDRWIREEMDKRGIKYQKP